MNKQEKMAVLAADGFDILNPSTCLWQVRENSFQFARESGHFPYEKRVHWNGLRSMVEKAMADFVQGAGHQLPWNLAGPTWAGFRSEETGRLPKIVDTAEYERIRDDFYRFSGWLRAAALLPGLRAAIKATTQVNGMNCPWTTQNLWDVYRRFPSPGNLERLLWKSKRRAEEVARPYGVNRIGWAMTLDVLMKHVQKAPLHLAAAAVNAAVVRKGGGLAFTGRPVDVLVKARGLKNELIWLRPEQFLWATGRVEAGEFASLREAGHLATERLVCLSVTDGEKMGSHTDFWCDKTLAMVYQGNADMVSYPTIYQGDDHVVTYRGGVYLTSPGMVGFWQTMLEAKHREMFGGGYGWGLRNFRPKDRENLFGFLRREIARCRDKAVMLNRTYRYEPRKYHTGYKGWELAATNPARKEWVIENWLSGEYYSLADALTASKERLTPDTTDGVQLLVDISMMETIHRVEVIPGWTVGGGKQLLLRQQGTGRTFHTNKGRDGMKGAVKRAIAAWRKQAELDFQNREFLSAIQPQNATILVFPTDSRPHNAGNCVSGTDSWLQSHGWGERWYVPVSELLKFRNEERVMRVLKVVAASIAK